MEKERLHRLGQALNALQNTYNDLIIIRDEEEHDFDNTPDDQSDSEFAELAVKNAEDIGAAVYDLDIVIDILTNVVNNKKNKGLRRD